MHKLINDIKGYMTGEVYGRRDDDVTIYSYYGDVRIVENKKGNRFSCLRDDLKEIEKGEIINNLAPEKSAGAIKQNLLF